MGKLQTLASFALNSAHYRAVMLRFPNTLDVIFGAGMTQIAWRARLVGSARCADRTPQRGVPTVVLTRIDFERLTIDVMLSEAKHLWFIPLSGIGRKID